MAEITNPQAVRFCNERVRRAADRYGQLYFWAKAIAAEWTAEGLAAVIPDTPDLVVDGSAEDGRTPIDGADVHAIKDLVAALIASMEADGNANLNQVIKVAVNNGV